jgi:hypothetical protein
METFTPPEQKTLRSSVYDRIECEKICPHSRLFFLTQEYFIWAVWIGSVFIGALAVAVSLFVLQYKQYAFYEATHENFFTFAIEALPYIWIALFGLMAFVAVYNIRHTKRGYRYPLWQILGSSLVLSVAGGAALQTFGFGYSVDHLLGQQMPMYGSQEKLEEKLWQNPNEGRLIGHMLHQAMVPTSTVVFTDDLGDRWQVDVSELSIDERDLLEAEETVRLIGQVSEKDVKFFHSCGVFPWIANKPMSREDMHAAREAFVMKVQGYKERAEKIAKPQEEANEQSVDSESPCGTIAPVRRMQKKVTTDKNNED